MAIVGYALRANAPYRGANRSTQPYSGLRGGPSFKLEEPAYELVHGVRRPVAVQVHH